MLEYMALNERAVNCLRGIFANYEGIMKINAELQRKESRKQIPKTVLDDIRKTIGCFIETIGCFYQQFIKTT